MDCFFLSFEWYKRCNWAKNFFPEAKMKERKRINSSEVSASCLMYEHLFSHESRICALKQGRIVIAEDGRSNCKLYLKRSILLLTFPTTVGS
jgi:hypothetical protein